MSFDKESVLKGLKDSSAQTDVPVNTSTDEQVNKQDEVSGADMNQNIDNIRDTDGETSGAKAADFIPKLDKLGRAYATGRRKESVACVWVKPGKGEAIINGKSIKDYFYDLSHHRLINEVFYVVDAVGKFDIMVKVNGGGLSGQAGAIRHGLSRALLNFDPFQMKSHLKKVGFLTRDARSVERKKPGLPKARKKKQFSKR